MKTWLVLSLFLLMGSGFAWAAEPRLDSFGDPLPAGAIARYGTTRLVHTHLKQLAFAPSGKLLVSNSPTDLRVWDMSDGRLLHRHPSVNAFAFTPESLMIAQGSDLRLVDAATGKVQRVLDQHGDGVKAQEIAVSGNGKIAAVSWTKAGMLVYDLTATGDVKARPLCPEGPIWLSLSATGNLLAGYSEQEVQVWDVTTVAKRQTIKLKETRSSRDSSLALSPDGTRVALADHDKVLIWLTATGKAPKGYQEPKGEFRSLRFSTDGQTLTGLATNGEVVVWSASTGKQESRHGVAQTQWVSALADDGVTLAANQQGDSSLIRVRDVKTDKDRFRFGRPVWDARFVEPGLIFSRSPNDSIIWGADDGKVRSQLKDTRGDLSPDGKYLATEQGDKFPPREVLITEVSSGKVVSRFTSNGGVEAWAPDSKTILTWSHPDEDKGGTTYNLWDAASGRLLRSFPYEDWASEGITFSPDGRTLVTGEKDVLFREVVTGQFREKLQAPVEPPLGDRENPERTFRFSRDGRTLLVVRNHDLFVISCKTRRLLFQLHTGESGTVGALSPDGRWLATGNGAAVEVRDLNNARALFEPHRFEGHEGGVDHLNFSADGKSLVSVGDGTALVWDLRPLIEGAATPSPALDDKRLAEWWTALGAEPKKAGVAMLALEQHPDRAVAFAAAHLRPTTAPAPEHMAKWIGDLDSDDFDRREKATQELERLAELAEHALRERLSQEPSAEWKRRAEGLLERLNAVEKEPERLQGLRSVELLERIGTAEARKILEALAKGAPQAKLTREAKSSLKRWPLR